MKTYDFYIYLAKRDKQGVRILAKFLSKHQTPTRINDDNISSLNIPINYLNTIKQTIYDSRMLWEPWVETVTNFNDFKNVLIKRGYSNIPLVDRPEVVSESVVLYNKLENKVSMLRKI